MVRRYCDESASTQSSLHSDITFLVPEDIIISKMKQMNKTQIIWVVSKARKIKGWEMSNNHQYLLIVIWNQWEISLQQWKNPRAQWKATDSLLTAKLHVCLCEGQVLMAESERLEEHLIPFGGWCLMRLPHRCAFPSFPVWKLNHSLGSDCLTLKDKRLLELSHPPPLICCRMTQALPSFSFLWLSSCLSVYLVPEWKRQMGVL